MDKSRTNNENDSQFRDSEGRETTEDALLDEISKTKEK